jgi:ABC-type Mn2+/Zn2+ transport system permease subunit
LSHAFGRLIHIDIYHFIVGSVLATTNAELWLLGIVTSIVLSVATVLLTAATDEFRSDHGRIDRRPSWR